MRLEEPSWWYGDGRHFGHRLVTGCLAPLGALYGWAARARYARTEPYRARLPVVCVGNLTVGGTGKTPLTLDLCRRLQAGGKRPVILTRGFGGTRERPHWVSHGDSPDEVGDEALLLVRAAPVLIARDRAAGAREIERALGAGTVSADVIVMDDGLQNPQLAKDLTLAVVDGARGLGNGRVLPAGPLRAPVSFQLGLIDAIVLNERAPGAGDVVAESLRGLFGGPILRCSAVAAADTAWLTQQRVVAWAGIGAPQRFFTMLESLGADLVATEAFGDHQRLSETDAARLLAAARRHQATLVSTEKDMARLKGAGGSLAALADATRVLPIELKFAEPDARRLEDLLAAQFERRRG